MTGEYIHIKVTECREVLLRNWDLLSEPTKEQLRSIGINPETE